ncbi:RNA polymerase sigma factor [Dokdonella soli]|uniref:RNA polymerase sigma factor n=1 Tax=Dokdonella soli TaxID=529810 RepID=UPI0031D36595
MRAVATGDRDAFERLYLLYHGRLARFLARHTAQRNLVDEIVNETLWVVWRTAGEFRGDSKVGTWIVSIAYRCLLKTMRDQLPTHRQTQPAGDEVSFEEVPSEQNEADQRELRDWVSHGLKLLPPEQRMTMELVYYFGQSYEEVATIMHCAVGTVKARMFHARLRLRNTLPRLGGESATNPRSAKG